jgi:hypothetical protein
LSPYLNLLRGGNPAANYYLGVVPDRYQRAYDVQVQTQLYQLERQVTTNADLLEEGAPSLRSTGHPAQFMNYGPYYNLSNNLRFNPSNTQRAVPPLPGQRIR